MSDPVILLIVAKTVLSVLLAAGGLVALVAGFRLYQRGVGLAADGSTVSATTGDYTIEVGLKSVGAVVMATSVAWGFLGYLAMPSYHRGSQSTDERPEAMGQGSGAFRSESVTVTEGIDPELLESLATVDVKELREAMELSRQAIASGVSDEEALRQLEHVRQLLGEAEVARQTPQNGEENSAPSRP